MRGKWAVKNQFCFIQVVGNLLYKCKQLWNKMNSTVDPSLNTKTSLGWIGVST